MGSIYLNGIPYAGGGSGGGDGQIIQVAILPEPSINFIDDIYQYIGPSNANYINGYFYKCVFKENSYIWEEIKTQSIADFFSVNGTTLEISDI